MKRVLCVRLPNWPRQRCAAVRQQELSDREALEQVAAWCDEFSPLVGVDTWEPPESLFFDVTGLGDLFHGERTLMEHVAREFGRRGLTAHLSLADTLGAAWALAHYGLQSVHGTTQSCPVGQAFEPDGHRSRFRQAGKPDLHSFRQAGKPDLHNGAFSTESILVPAGGTKAALLALPVAALRLSAKCVETLHQLGLRQVGQLFAFPRDSLAARFDSQLLLRLDQATGAVAETIAACHPAPQIEAEAVFEHPTARREMIEQALERQLESLVRQLSPRRQGVQGLVCRLRGETGKTSEITVGLYRPSGSPRHLAELIAMQWAPAHRQLAEPLAELRLSVTAAAPLEYHQQELFEELARPYDPRQTALLIDRLSSRLGRSSVVRPKLLPEAQPELAWRYEALVGGKRAKSRGAGQVPARRRTRQGDKETRRQGASGKHSPNLLVPLSPCPLVLPPGWLARPLSLVQPIAVQVVAVAPHGPPQTFFFSGEQHRVARTWGPERIHTGWWRGRSVRRDYYRVETATGRWFWLFRQLTDGRWYFHGAFD
ncbi:MAG TPA: DNA polymerase Y family protein [Pirellulales bacterium]|nr:DNA polymerase Y family protein [Pirellulales bacterium]